MISWYYMLTIDRARHATFLWTFAIKRLQRRKMKYRLHETGRPNKIQVIYVQKVSLSEHNLHLCVAPSSNYQWVVDKVAVSKVGRLPRGQLPTGQPEIGQTMVSLSCCTFSRRAADQYELLVRDIDWNRLRAADSVAVWSDSTQQNSDHVCMYTLACRKEGSFGEFRHINPRRRFWQTYSYSYSAHVVKLWDPGHSRSGHQVTWPHLRKKFDARH